MTWEGGGGGEEVMMLGKRDKRPERGLPSTGDGRGLREGCGVRRGG